MEHRRPDPDELLRGVQQAEERRNRGRLKIFLGAAAGVGKTYAMLSEGQEQKDRGVEVVVGYVELHGRPETEALLKDLEQLPPREVRLKGDVVVKEFDLDAALKRHPKLMLVDELAHTNAPDSRHPKRWQDIEELLHAGIDVFTTVNVQHLESLNDIVRQITNVTVQETVPDSFMERADDIELVDIPPDELRLRLKEGKVYVPQQIDVALEGFFKYGNLIALRELALRRTADRVDAEIQSFRSTEGVKGHWPTRDRIVVCVAPNRLAIRVVRAAARIGAATHADMIALYVESGRQEKRSAEDHERAREALRLAESLGMETVMLASHDIVGEVLAFAQKRNASLVVVGKPIRPRWREILYGSVVDEMVRHSGTIDVHVITGTEEGGRVRIKPLPSAGASWKGSIWAAAIVALATAICFLLYGRFDLANLVMVYLLGVSAVASRFGPRDVVLAALLSVAVFDFAFVPPRWTFAVSDTQYVVTFAVMLAVALLISSLTLRLRREVEASSERERRTAALYSLSKEISKSRNQLEIASAAANEIRAVFNGDAAVLAPENGKLEVIAKSKSRFVENVRESVVAQWTFEHGESAGLGTETLPASAGLYIPLRSSHRTLGVLAFRPNDESSELTPNQRHLLETFANGMALSMERAQLAAESHEARLAVEAERLRNALLSSISHDLRTPLTSIAGAASSLHDGKGDTKELAETIYRESMRLNLQVENLLDMTRLQSGDVELKLEWQSIEELVGAALSETRDLLEGREVTTEIPPNLPLLRLDGALIEKVLTNLIENAAHHTPKRTPIEIRAVALDEFVRLEVADRGPGIPKGEEAKIFERFAGRRKGEQTGGFGLGLTICRAIMRLHDGRIWAKNRPEGGAVFYVEFKRSRQVPEVPVG